jgi:integrase
MPNSKGRKRRFGSIRKTPRGEYQVSYVGPDGQRHFAPHRFPRERDADRWLAQVETHIVAGDWTDPDRAKITLGEYAEQWITERPGLRPRTLELYRWLLRKHIAPYLGGVPLCKLSAGLIRQWRSERLKAGVSESVLAKAYRLIRGVLNTAVEPDQLISRNPCRVPGADKEKPAERPVLTVAQIFDLADRMPARFRALVLLAAFGSLRWGEVTALRRCDMAEDAASVQVSRAFVEVPGLGLQLGPPKSRAGVRTVVLPEAIRPDLLRHVEEYVGGDSSTLLFTGERDGNALRRPNFNQRARWPKVVADLGLPGLHFHDLRHAGNIFASKAGMSTRDLMARMGHDDMRAALIYQRATSEADRKIADALSKLVDAHRGEAEDSQDDSASSK